MSVKSPRVVVSLAFGLLLTTACSASSPSPGSQSATSTPASVSASSTPRTSRHEQAIPWVALQNDYPQDETFCAREPLTGKIDYVVRGHRVTLRFHIEGLPRHSEVGVFWINNPARGYNIAFVRTTAAGTARQSTLRMFRGGEVYGQGLQLQNSKFRPIGQLEPC